MKNNLSAILIKKKDDMRELLLDIFREQGWQYTQPTEDIDLYVLNLTVHHGTIQCFAELKEDEDSFRFLSVCGTNAPEDRRIEVLSLITRLNYNLLHGNLEMHAETGEIRYKTTLYYQGFVPSREAIMFLININILCLDLALPGLIEVMLGNMNAVDAYLLIAPPVTPKGAGEEVPSDGNL